MEDIAKDHFDAPCQQDAEPAAPEAPPPHGDPAPAGAGASAPPHGGPSVPDATASSPPPHDEASAPGATGRLPRAENHDEAAPTAADAKAAAARATLAVYLASRSVDVALSNDLRSVYIKSGRDTALRGTLDDCLKRLGTRRRDGTPFEGRGIALLAESAAGKTQAVRRGLQTHPIFAAAGVNKPGSMAISVTCLGSCTLRVLGELILEACGYPVERGLRENEVWALVRHHLEMLGILVLHVDEVSNLLDNANVEDRKRIVNNLKALINSATWPVVLILSGIPSIGPVLKKDAQLRRRLAWVQLKPLEAPGDNATLAAFSAKLCAIAGIAPAPGFAATIAPRLIHASCAQLGLAAEMCVEAVEGAHAEGRTALGMDHFADMFAARTGCDASQNPFVNPAWKTTDPRVVLGLVQGEDDGDGSDDGPGKRGCGRPAKKGKR